MKGTERLVELTVTHSPFLGIVILFSVLLSSLNKSSVKSLFKLVLTCLI
ncbi:hypothetical protein ACSXAY_17010 (plasmid) [Clostridium perfringens]